MTDLTLKPRTGRAAASLATRAALVFAIRLLRLAVLARLLTAKDFGLFGLAMVVYQALETFTSLGLGTYLVQRKSLSSAVIGTAWSLSILRGGLVAAAVFLGAPLYADALGDPELVGVLRIVALASIVASFANPQRTLAERGIRFGRVVASEVLGMLAEALLVVGLAYALGNVQALAWAMVGGAGANVLLSFAFFPARFRPGFQRDAARDIVRTGKYLLIVSVGTFVTSQVDNLVTGLVLDVAAVGVYVIAYRLALMPLEFVWRLSKRLSVPVLSRLQTEPLRMQAALSRMVDLQLALLVPVTAFLIVYARPIVLAVYGADWVEVIPVISALSLVMVGRALSQVIVPYLVATGNFAVDAWCKVVEVAVFVPAIWYGGSNLGVIGIALGAGLSYLLAAALRVWAAARYGGAEVHWVRRILAWIVTTAPGILLGLGLIRLLNLEQPILVVLVASLSLGFAHLAMVWWFHPDLLRFIRSIVSATVSGELPALASNSDDPGDVS